MTSSNFDSLITELKDIDIYIKSNNFVGNIHYISKCFSSAAYEITYVNKQRNSYCIEKISYEHIKRLGYIGLITHIFKDNAILKTSLYKLLYD